MERHMESSYQVVSTETVMVLFSISVICALAVLYTTVSKASACSRLVTFTFLTGFIVIVLDIHALFLTHRERRSLHESFVIDKCNDPFDMSRYPMLYETCERSRNISRLEFIQVATTRVQGWMYHFYHAMFDRWATPGFMQLFVPGVIVCIVYIVANQMTVPRNLHYTDQDSQRLFAMQLAATSANQAAWSSPSFAMVSPAYQSQASFSSNIATTSTEATVVD